MRVLSFLAAAGVFAAGVIGAAPAAEAAGTCSLYVQSKISIGSPYRTITVKEGPNCTSAGVMDAYWTAVHPTQGEGVGADFENYARSTTVPIYDFFPLGKWTWRGDGAYKAADTTPSVYQYSPVTDVRLASYGRVYPTRTGSKVNIKTSANRYWAGGSKFIGWSGARGQIQYRTPGTTTWKGLKDVYSTSTGAYSYTYSTTAVREYRVVLYAVSTIWESTSPIVKK
ncbi:hypothetical protein EV646_103201 [Kribbella antiqua]|uniref:Uncharacterized protein n=1 Tax=Kribbella antiqua TaxID=2512217 RepID=A0A4R2IUH9_9ACTN|nr:hypothetical protein [Kribbella antiqua]TCO49223.1 hypothetical protein EV646_103201 [Kribbella antiqua]